VKGSAGLGMAYQQSMVGKTCGKDNLWPGVKNRRSYGR